MEIYSLQERRWLNNITVIYQRKRKVGYMDSRFRTRRFLQSEWTGISCWFNICYNNLSSSSSSSTGSSTNSGTSVANMTIGTQTGATSAIDTIDAALNYVQAERSNLGAIQNRLTYTVDNLTNAMTNAASAGVVF